MTPTNTEDLHTCRRHSVTTELYTCESTYATAHKWSPEQIVQVAKEFAKPCYDRMQNSYHNWQHVEAVLAHLDRICPAVVDKLPLQLAAIFHDIDASVRVSADRAYLWMIEDVWQHLDSTTYSGLAEKVRYLVLATEKHLHGEDRLASYLIDADLAILAAPTRRYEWYCDAIREEYAGVDLLTYIEGRIAVLQRLMQRAAQGKLYRCCAAWNEQALANMCAEIDRLEDAKYEELLEYQPFDWESCLF